MQYRPRISRGISLILVYLLYWGIPLFLVGIQAKIHPSEVNVFYKKDKTKKEIVSAHKDSGKKIKLLQKKRFLPETLWCLIVDNTRVPLFYTGYVSASLVLGRVHLDPIVTDPLRGPPACS